MVRLRWLPSLLLTFLISISWAELDADTIYLRNGEVLTGEVIDQGDEVHLKQKLGGVKIAKKDIERIVYDKPETEPDSEAPDIVIQTDGTIIRGRARISPNGKEVWVYIKDQRVAIPQDHVREILWKGKGKAQGESKEKILERISELLETLRSKDTDTRLEAADELKRLGIFAIPTIEKALREAPEQDPRRPVLEEVLRYHRLKSVIGAAIESSIRDVYTRLASTDPKTRASVLKEVVIEQPDTSPKVLVHFLREDPDPGVRALCISQLSMLRCFDELAVVLKTPNGRLRMAAAIALGEHGIMAGVPVLIDALAFTLEPYDAVLADPKSTEEARELAQNQKRQVFGLRTLADLKLREFTGKDFGYRPLASRADQAKAIVRWRNWWQENRDAMLEQSAKLVSGQSADSVEQKEAYQFWAKGNTILDDLEGQADLAGKDRRLKFERAAFFFKKAIQRDPNFTRARLSLAYVCYNELDRLEEAKNHLRSVLNQTQAEPSPIPRRLAYYHLAAVARHEGNFEEAQLRLYDALKLDGSDLDLHLALGELYLDWALINASSQPEFTILESGQLKEKDEKEPGVRRVEGKEEEQKKKAQMKLVRARLIKAQTAFKRGLAELFAEEEKLREEAQKLIDTKESNVPKAALLQSLKANIRTLGLRSAPLYFGLARAEAGLRFYRSAEKNFAMATRMNPKNERYEAAAKYWKELIEERDVRIRKRVDEEKPKKKE